MKVKKLPAVDCNTARTTGGFFTVTNCESTGLGGKDHIYTTFYYSDKNTLFMLGGKHWHEVTIERDRGFGAIYFPRPDLRMEFTTAKIRKARVLVAKQRNGGKKVNHKELHGAINKLLAQNKAYAKALSETEVKLKDEIRLRREDHKWIARSLEFLTHEELEKVNIGCDNG